MLSESSTRQPGEDSAIRTLGSFSIINEIHDSSPKAALIEFPVPSLQHPALEHAWSTISPYQPSDQSGKQTQHH
jgi:hypothetical protein